MNLSNIKNHINKFFILKNDFSFFDLNYNEYTKLHKDQCFLLIDFKELKTTNYKLKKFTIYLNNKFLIFNDATNNFIDIIEKL